MVKIEKFLKNLKLDEKVKSHLEYTTYEYEEYINKLKRYSDNAQYIFLLDLAFKENKSSSTLERELYSKPVIDKYISLFSNNNNINENMLFEMHKAVLANNQIKHRIPGEYRKHEVWIGNPGEGIEYAFHIPPKPLEIKDYMKDFINFYNDDNQDLQLDNLFIKGAIIHILLIKIHPFADGNGRMSRILQNHKLQTLTNKLYNTNFKFSPINMSKSYDMTRLTYFKLQNDIKFNEEIDNNCAFNKWFDYVLTMIDEQLFYSNNLLQKYNYILSNFNFPDNKKEKLK